MGQALPVARSAACLYFVRLVLLFLVFVLVFRSVPEHRVAGAAAARLQESAVPLYLDTTLIGSQCLCLNPFYVRVRQCEVVPGCPTSQSEIMQQTEGLR